MDDADLNPATAAALDVAPQNLADRTAFLLGRSIAPALNFTPPVTAVSVAGGGFFWGSPVPGLAGGCNSIAGAATWDSQTGQWYVLANNTNGNTGTFAIYQTIDGGKTFNAYYTQADAASTGRAIAAHAGAIIIAGCNGTAVGYINAAGAHSSTFASPFDADGGATALWHNGAGKYLLVGEFQAGPTAQFNAVSTPDGASFTNQTTALPAVWQSSTNHPGRIFNAQSATIALIATGGATAGTDTARLMQVTAGLVFTDITPGVLANQIITGIAFSASSNLWILVAYNGTDSHLYTSPDLSTWTLAHTFAATTATGLATCGGLVAVTVLFTYNSLPVSRIMVSTDFASGASSTWHYTAGAFPGNSGFAVLASSGQQLLAVTDNGAQLQISDMMGLT